MTKKPDYSSLFTLRKDGRYMGYWRDGRGRHAVYSKDPEKLYNTILEKEKCPRGPLTFREVAEKWELTHMEKTSRGTQSGYRRPLRSLVEEFGDTPVANITAADVDRVLLREKAEGYSYKHASTIKSVMKQILDMAVLSGDIMFNPVTSVRIPRGLARSRVEAPDTDVVDVIVANLDKPFGDFVAMLLYTGMRTEEAAALTWGDIGEKYINVHASVDLHGTPVLKETKTVAGERLVPILTRHRPFLVRPKGAKKTDYIFNDNGALLTRGKITARWRRWCRDAGLADIIEYRGKRGRDTQWQPTVMPHQLRHHYATVLYEQKVDLLTAKDIMGHKDIQTTQKIYTSLREKHREEEIAKIDGGF